MQKGLAVTVGDTNAAELTGVRGWEIGSLGLAFLVSLSLYLARGYEAVGYVSPLTILAVLGFANWRMVKDNPAALWTPLFAFRTAAAVFLGFGGFLTVNLSVEAQARYFSELTYTEAEAAYVFLVWLTGIFLTLLGCFLASKVSPWHRDLQQEAQQVKNPPTLRLGLIFFLAGLAFYLVIELPRALGFADIGIIPNAIAQPFQAALAVGVFLISLWALEKGKAALLAIPVVITLASLAGFIGLNKTGVILPLIFFVLAFLYRKVSIVRVALVVVLLVSAFSVLQPMVAHARDLAGEDLGTTPTLAERYELYQDFFQEGNLAREESNVETDFLRFGHTHVAAFVIDRYQTGMRSDELEGALGALVPRILWPDKPVVTQGAENLYFMVSGRYGSALATTTFADIYWNGGWLALVIICLVWGALMWIGTTTAFDIVRKQDWVLMPYVLLVFRIGLSQESAFVVAIFIPTVMAAIAYFMFKWGKPLIALKPQTGGGPRNAHRLSMHQ